MEATRGADVEEDALLFTELDSKAVPPDCKLDSPAEGVGVAVPAL